MGPLPESENRNGSFDMIWVILDHLTCMVHLKPTNQNYRARHTAEVVVDTVYKLHGSPERILSVSGLCSQISFGRHTQLNRCTA